MNRTARQIAFALCLLAAPSVLATTSARAQSATPGGATGSERAADLKKQGDAAMESLRYADALGAYAQAYALKNCPKKAGRWKWTRPLDRHSS